MNAQQDKSPMIDTREMTPAMKEIEASKRKQEKMGNEG